MTPQQLEREVDQLEFEMERLRLHNLLERKSREFEEKAEEAHDIYREYLIILNQYYAHVGKIVHFGRL